MNVSPELGSLLLAMGYLLKLVWFVLTGTVAFVLLVEWWADRTR